MGLQEHGSPTIHICFLRELPGSPKGTTLLAVISTPGNNLCFCSCGQSGFLIMSSNPCRPVLPMATSVPKNLPVPYLFYLPDSITSSCSSIPKFSP